MRSPQHSHAVVEAWFDTLPPEQRTLARELQRLLIDAVPTLGQVVKWGNLVFLHRGTHALAVAPHKGQVKLQVFNGGQLAARFATLVGAGKGMRHLTWRVGQPVDAAQVGDLARACVATLPGRPAVVPTPRTGEPS